MWYKFCFKIKSEHNDEKGFEIFYNKLYKSKWTRKWKLHKIFLLWIKSKKRLDEKEIDEVLRVSKDYFENKRI